MIIYRENAVNLETTYCVGNEVEINTLPGRHRNLEGVAFEHIAV